ncbi:YidC/Oxa1 family membrane protein insertase [Roseburia sp. MSJ-14]|uniref:YidC/Oxa1 family membrane protein insertase n=1 Tax=Roseburia sp. MSJ-14 TaxID=2841514 RepID=UPI0020A014A3|nr:YidC/Oxa1 family membrane protein insertase [Roseburia sp. MSJ-14]
MTQIILTQYSGKIIGPIAKLIGYIMNYLYMFLDKVFGIQNIGICIILFTFIIYMCMIPLTYKQQKFSKLSQKMQPEIKEIQKKYQGKKDQSSMMKMNEETQAVYEKYGVSPTGSCVQMLIQMPILLAMYRVVYNVPAYVSSVKEVYIPLVDKITSVSGFQDIITKFVSDVKVRPMYGLNFDTATSTSNSIIDVLYALPSHGWDMLKESFSGLSDVISSTASQVSHLNNFLGINIANTPFSMLKNGWSEKDFILIIAALAVPLISYLTQVINIKLMPTAANANGDNDAMARQMKTMNMMMPLFSLFMCFSVPVGLGIYWIAGSVIRCIQQLIINKRMENLDLDDIIEKNKEKARKKKEKRGVYQNQIANAAKMNTRNIKEPMSEREKDEKIRQTEEYAKKAKTGSLLEKANMVKEFNERNNK